MKKTNYPGYAVKISRWRRFMMWLWAVRHPFRYKGVIGKIKADQEVLDTLYNMILEREIKREFPPLTIKDK
jgi:hypothetical protein